MTRRVARDPEGRRRASVEAGLGKPRNQTQGGKPKRKPSTSMPRKEGRGARLGRRLSAVGRFGVKHRGSLLCIAGAVAAAAMLLVFEVGVFSVQTAICAGVAGVGVAVQHHQRTKTMSRNPNVYTPTWSERAQYERARRATNGGVPQFSGGGPVHVASSDRAQAHTRARPGEGKVS